jgi:hypothetical protein
MRRRLIVPIALCLLLTRLAWAEPDDAPLALPQYKVSAAQLQTAVAQRFPMRYPVQGLMNLDVQVPTLRPQDLALPDGLGMQPGSITVTNEGLTIGFVPKPWP